MIDNLLLTLKSRDPLAPLCPEKIWQPEISKQISAASDMDLFGSDSADEAAKEMRLACRAGLLLLNDDLSASHDIAQQIETPTGSFWHAIMHRREGDFSNANYWFLKSGAHPAFEDVHSKALTYLNSQEDASVQDLSWLLQNKSDWLPMEFVELCKMDVAAKCNAHWAQELQLIEMTSLLDWCLARI